MRVRTVYSSCTVPGSGLGRSALWCVQRERIEFATFPDSSDHSDACAWMGLARQTKFDQLALNPRHVAPACGRKCLPVRLPGGPSGAATLGTAEIRRLDEAASLAPGHGKPIRLLGNTQALATLEKLGNIASRLCPESCAWVAVSDQRGAAAGCRAPVIFLRKL